MHGHQVFRELDEDRGRIFQFEPTGDGRILDASGAKSDNASGKQSIEAREPRIVTSLRVKSARQGYPQTLLHQPQSDDPPPGGDQVDRLFHGRRRAGGFHHHRHGFAPGHVKYARQQPLTARQRYGARLRGNPEPLG